jgi:hypothetical protein
MMTMVEPGSIGYVEVAHEFLEIGQWGFYDDVKVVGHENEGQNIHLINLG